MKHKIVFTVVASLLVALFTATGINSLVSQKNKLHLQDVQLKTKSDMIQQLELNHDTIQKQLQQEKAQSSQNTQKVQELQQKDQENQQKIDDLEKQLQARAAAKQAQIAQANSVSNAVSNAIAPKASAVANCGDNSYANYIYMHESGCQTHNPNSSGCDGIGQACPASKVIGTCGYDYACQNAWFTQYANDRYGGWAGAYAFWVSHGWW